MTELPNFRTENLKSMTKIKRVMTHHNYCFFFRTLNKLFKREKDTNLVKVLILRIPLERLEEFNLFSEPNCRHFSQNQL